MGEHVSVTARTMHRTSYTYRSAPSTGARGHSTECAHPASGRPPTYPGTMSYRGSRGSDTLYPRK